MPFTLHAPELIVILVIVLLIFGVGRLPEVGGALGKGLREFRRAVTGGSGESKQDTDEAKDEAKDEATDKS